MDRWGLAGRRLYLVCDASFTDLEEAFAGGVDLLELRDRSLPDGELLAAARRMAGTARAHGVPFLVNDRVDIALLAGADGVHVGQDDLPPSEVRKLVGPGAIVGLSTHSPGQLAAARDVDYVAVGPVHATPTKAGRPAVGLDLVRHAAAHAPAPWFAIGGIDPETIDAVAGAGATRVVVVRAITQSRSPRAAAEALRARLPR